MAPLAAVIEPGPLAGKHFPPDAFVAALNEPSFPVVTRKA
jgi:hypothetical protein